METVAVSGSPELAEELLRWLLPHTSVADFLLSLMLSSSAVFGFVTMFLQAVQGCHGDGCCRRLPRACHYCSSHLDTCAARICHITCRLYKDAMETVAVSSSPELAEELLRWLLPHTSVADFLLSLVFCCLWVCDDVPAGCSRMPWRRLPSEVPLSLHSLVTPLAAAGTFAASLFQSSCRLYKDAMEKVAVSGSPELADQCYVPSGIAALCISFTS
jgi:hypothetical protein